MLFGIFLGTAYIPYLAFVGVKNVYQAMVLTIILPLGSICWFGGAMFEKYIYRPLNLS